MWKWIVPILIVIIVLLAVSYSLANDLFKSMFRRRQVTMSKDGDYKNYYQEIKENEKRIKKEFKDVFIETEGIKLHGLLKLTESDVCVITIHDVHSDPILNNAIVNPYLIDSKYNVLMLELRGHGRSEGDYVGFGAGDVKDILEWIKYIRNTLSNNLKIAIHGSGIGAYAAILMGDVEGVKAIIADSSVISAYDYLKQYFRINKINKFPTLWFIKRIVKAKLKYDITSSVFEKVKHLTTPIMFMHSREDIICDPVNTAQLYQVCNSTKEIHVYSGSKHLMAYLDNKKEYKENVLNFIRKETNNK